MHTIAPFLFFSSAHLLQPPQECKCGQIFTTEEKIFPTPPPPPPPPKLYISGSIGKGSDYTCLHNLYVRQHYVKVIHPCDMIKGSITKIV